MPKPYRWKDSIYTLKRQIGNKEVHTLSKGISPKVNIIARPLFEPDY